MVKRLARCLQLPLTILERSPAPLVTPVVLEDGQVFGPLLPSLASSPVDRSRFPPRVRADPTPSPPSPHACPRSHDHALSPAYEAYLIAATWRLHVRRHLVDPSVGPLDRLLASGILLHLVPLPPLPPPADCFVCRPMPARASPPVLPPLLIPPSPFISSSVFIGGPSHKSFSRPRCRVAGSRRRPPRSRPLFCYRTSSPRLHSSPPLSPRLVPTKELPERLLEANGTFWTALIKPRPLPRPDHLLEVSEVLWRATIYPRPPRPDPP